MKYIDAALGITIAPRCQRTRLPNWPSQSHHLPPECRHSTSLDFPRGFTCLPTTNFGLSKLWEHPQLVWEKPYIYIAQAR